ncbi:amidohydrolase [bacterium]|nr:amidohydrolase [bacterium]
MENHDFKVFKIYLALSYDPDHPLFIEQIYPYMVEKIIPLMTHCSPGIVYDHAEGKEQANRHGHPDNYVPVMERYPGLRICLAHFGGIGEWRKYVDEPSERTNTWLGRIRKLLKSGNSNLFTDISYTVFNFQKNVPFLKVFLEDSDIASQILFGSDYFMVYNKKYSEKRLSIDLRATLGEDKFWLIAHDNPKRYLGIK